MTKKQLLFKNMERCINEQSYFAMLVENASMPKSEVIINDWSNLYQKMEYIDKAYTDDLILKSCDDIKIKDFCQGMTFEEIETKLICNWGE